MSNIDTDDENDHPHRYDDRIYGINDEEKNIFHIDRQPNVWIQIKDIFTKNLQRLWNNDDFQSEFIVWQEIEEHGEEDEHYVYGRYIIECALQLVDIVIASLGNKINISYTQSLLNVCFVISLKLIAHDWLWDDQLDGIYEFMISHEPVNGVHRNAKKLRAMESDVMRRTGWKGCPIAGIE